MKTGTRVRIDRAAYRGLFGEDRLRDHDGLTGTVVSAPDSYGDVYVRLDGTERLVPLDPSGLDEIDEEVES
jgi:hypothetical protein